MQKILLLKKGKVETELDKLITASSDLARQKEFEALSTKVYKANSTGADKTTWDALVDIVTFKDGQTPKNWIDVVESVSLIPGVWPTGTAAKDAPVKMQINLKGGYIAANAAKLSIDTNITVAITADTTLTVTKGVEFDNSRLVIEAYLEIEFGKINSDAEREEHFNYFIERVIVNDNNIYWPSLSNMLIFKDGETPVRFENAVKNITFVPGAWPAGNQAKEAPVEMKINLNPGYNVADAAILSIDISITIPPITSVSN